MRWRGAFATRVATGGAALALLVGCSFQSLQVDGLRRVAGDLGRQLGAGEQREALQIDPRYEWLLRLNGLETVVYLADLPAGYVFGNRQGTQVRFDGWDVVSAAGLPNAIRGFEVEKRGDGLRIHRIFGVGTFRLRCEPPQRAGRGWRTPCTCTVGAQATGEGVEVPMVQRVHNDANGNILRIEAELVPGAAPLTLERLHPELGPKRAAGREQQATGPEQQAARRD